MNAENPKETFLSFKESVLTLNLSTLDEQAKAKPRTRASYAPFVEDDNGNFYIFVSQLASHTQDLQLNPEASILLLQDEQDTRQIFARQRISYQCNVKTIPPEDEEYPRILERMEQRFGNIIDLLKTLPDFVLFQLTPYEGLYVKGFGKAYKLVGDNLLELEHVTS